MTIDFVRATNRPQAWYCYANDWQGEGDVRVAIIEWRPEGFVVLWDDTPGKEIILSSFMMATMLVQRDAAQHITALLLDRMSDEEYDWVPDDDWPSGSDLAEMRFCY